MKCSKCGITIPEKANYCPQCGNKVQREQCCINGHPMKIGQKYCCQCGAPSMACVEYKGTKDDESKSKSSESMSEPPTNKTNINGTTKFEEFKESFFYSIITIGVLLLLALIIQECQDFFRNKELKENSEYATEARENNIIYDATTGIINGHEWVDLGLPSGLKWATCNVGASAPTEYGNYYSWGETKTKSSYDTLNLTRRMNNNRLRSAGIINSLGNLMLSHDAARANWGGSWRMPTKNECEELRKECNWYYCILEGIGGYRLTGPNGCSIFIPAAGFRNDYRNNLLRRAGNNVKLWSSTSGGDEHMGYQNIGQAYAINVEDYRYDQDYIFRNFGLPVRAVSE